MHLPASASRHTLHFCQKVLGKGVRMAAYLGETGQMVMLSGALFILLCADDPPLTFY